MISSACLCLFIFGLDSALASSATLLPLERQKKSLQEDLAFFLPEKTTRTVFRERHSGSTKSTTKPNKRSGYPSIFSERQHLIEAKNAAKEMKLKRALGPLAKGHSAQSYAPYQEQWDPWFPALPAKKRLELDSEREAIDSALKHMAWERLNKRLIKLNGLHGPYLDRGERRMRIKKRSQKPSENKKELEAILSDDDEERQSQAKQGQLAPSKNGTENVVKKQLTSSQSEKPNAQKGPKGKQWMPLDSEPTLRSKKSWDDYFGINKRSFPQLPNPEQKLASDNEDDDNDESEDELKDYLVQWYFNKMLRHFSAQPLKEGEANSGNEAKKKKNLKSLDVERKSKDENEIDSVDISDGIPFKEVDERLRKIEDAILSEATHIIESGMNDNKPEGAKNADESAMDEAENDVIDHLKAAYSLEKMRDALGEFQNSFSKIKLQESLLDPVAAEKFNDDAEKKKKRKKSEANFEETEEDDEDDFDKKKKKSGVKKSISADTQSANEKNWAIASGSIKSDLTNEVAAPVFAPEPHDEHFLPCPVMTDALGYCEELSDALGEMGQMLARQCVEHMICYTCDETPSACDVAFLQDAAKLCEDDFRCQAIAGAMRSVFLSNHDEFRYQHEALCDGDQCLRQLQLRK